jgi:tetratricopeptide (TPR) repeat protein
MHDAAGRRGYNQISIPAASSQSVADPRAATRGVSAALTPSPMSIRPLCCALVLAVAFGAASAVRADELKDIEALYHAGNVDQALRRADEAIAAQPRAAQIRFLKGMMLSASGRTAEAIDVYVALTQDFPELAGPYNNLAVLYAASGQLQQALDALQSALRNDPQNRRARENLGDVYLAMAVQAWNAAAAQGKGDDAELQRKLKQAEEIVPQFVSEGRGNRRR